MLVKQRSTVQHKPTATIILYVRATFGKSCRHSASGGVFINTAGVTNERFLFVNSADLQRRNKDLLCLQHVWLVVGFFSY